MALLLPNSIFVHTPKCGGHWIRAAIKQFGIETIEIGHEHDNFTRESLRSCDQECYRDKIAFTFVRHPLSWYQSYWAFRMKRGWLADHPLDINCTCNDFETFVRNVLNYCPEGWVTKMYEEYTYVPAGIRLLVGKQEQLRFDFTQIMSITGDQCNDNIINNMPAVNDSTIDGKTSSRLAMYSNELRDQVLSIEHAVIDRWYQKGLEQ